MGHAWLKLADHFLSDQVALGNIALVHAYVAAAANDSKGNGERDDLSQFLHLGLFFTIVVSVDHTRPNQLLRRATMADQNHELRKAGLKVTLPRVKILQILENVSGQHHLSAEEVYKTLIDAGEDVGLATVYRVLTQFESAGLVIRHNFDGGHAVFEMTQEDHHDHMCALKAAKSLSSLMKSLNAVSKKSLKSTATN
ncbi:Ferric-uptake regulator [Vreelandella titanicae BH1]|uniref:Ferric uptake regulation protein n=1 Tax=Vreelandella titanicae BH1 TaxID=1204738 RepID=L9U7Q4_9GAMM|nr:Ferric-uptake regulator [Halomonas titanicae BH1]